MASRQPKPSELTGPARIQQLIAYLTPAAGALPECSVPGLGPRKATRKPPRRYLGGTSAAIVWHGLSRCRAIALGSVRCHYGVRTPARGAALAAPECVAQPQEHGESYATAYA